LEKKTTQAFTLTMGGRMEQRRGEGGVVAIQKEAIENAVPIIAIITVREGARGKGAISQEAAGDPGEKKTGKVRLRRRGGGGRNFPREVKVLVFSRKSLTSPPKNKRRGN